MFYIGRIYGGHDVVCSYTISDDSLKEGFIYAAGIVEFQQRDDFHSRIFRDSQRLGYF